jgi:hypothetical protein
MTSGMGLFDLIVTGRLWNTARAVIRAFYEPEPLFEISQGFLAAILVAGVFLVVAGAALAASGHGRPWRIAALAVAAGAATWVVLGGMTEVAGFFAVIALLLKFLGGVTLIVGFFRSAWVLALLLAAILVGATGLVPEQPLGQAVSATASFLGALSLFRKAEEFSPGRRGSRWNRATAAGWVLCLFAAGEMQGGSLAAHGGTFKVAGIVVGLGLVLLSPRLLRRGGVKVGLARR